MKIMKTITVLVLVIGLMVSSLGTVFAQDASPDSTEIEGVIAEIDIAEVDTEASTVTIAPEEGDAVTLTVDEDTLIQKDNEDASLDVLAIGDEVSALYGEDLVAVQISAQAGVPLEIEGVIEAVDTETGTVTIAPEEGDAVPLTVVEGITVIEKNGEAASLDLLQQFDQVEASYYRLILVAVSIVAESPALEPAVISGVIPEGGIQIYGEGDELPVEGAIGLVTIVPEEADPVSLIVTQETVIIKGEDEEAGIEALEEGDQVQAIYDPTTNVALEIEAIALEPEEGEPLAGDASGPRGLFGGVTSVDIGEDGVGSITLETKAWGTVTVNVDGETKYHVTPALGHPWREWDATAEYVKVDDRVAVLLSEARDVALKVMVLPGSRPAFEPLFEHHSGVVIEASGVTITIVDQDGNTTTIEIPEGVTINLPPGQFATIIGRNVPGGVNPKAVAAHKIEKLIERLNKHIDRLTASLEVLEGTTEEGEDTGGESTQIMSNLDRLSALVEQNMGRHLGVLKNFSQSEDFPSQVRAQIESGLETSVADHGTALGNLGHHLEQVRERWEAKMGKWEEKWEAKEGKWEFKLESKGNNARWKAEWQVDNVEEED